MVSVYQVNEEYRIGRGERSLSASRSRHRVSRDTNASMAFATLMHPCMSDLFLLRRLYHADTIIE